MTQKTLPATKTPFSNFRKHPGRLLAILMFYFLFLSEWGVYYYTLYKEFSDYIFGDFPDKTNFYIKVIAESGIFIIYTYVAYKMAKVMFGNNSSFTEKTAALMNSLCCLVFWSFFVRITLFGISDLVHLNKHYLLNLKHRSNTSNQLLIDRNKTVLYLLNRFKKLFFLPQNRTKQEHTLQNVIERRKNER